MSIVECTCRFSRTDRISVGQLNDTSVHPFETSLTNREQGMALHNAVGISITPARFIVMLIAEESLMASTLHN